MNIGKTLDKKENAKAKKDTTARDNNIDLNLSKPFI